MRRTLQTVIALSTRRRSAGSKLKFRDFAYLPVLNGKRRSCLTKRQRSHIAWFTFSSWLEGRSGIGREVSRPKMKAIEGKGRTCSIFRSFFVPVRRSNSQDGKRGSWRESINYLLYVIGFEERDWLHSLYAVSDCFAWVTRLVPTRPFDNR